MAVYRLFRNAGFDPEHIEGLSKAYDDTLRSLQLVNRTDPLTELIAKTIIRAAQTGERNPDRLRESTIAELGLGAAPRSSVENGADEVPAKGRSLTVLLVDDDATFAYAASRFFRARGHTPLVAPGSIAAFRELERQPVDAVITDIRLGDGEPHGAALGRMIRNRDPKMPVLLVTAYPDLLESEKPLPGPAFIKPVELRELARVVEASVAA